MTARFVSDEKLKTAPPLPLDRPPTRAEVWAYVRHLYHDLWPEEKLKTHAAETWAGNYVTWVNNQGWSKRPDWQPGDDESPVVERPIDVANANYRYVKSLMGGAT